MNTETGQRTSVDPWVDRRRNLTPPPARPAKLLFKAQQVPAMPAAPAHIHKQKPASQSANAAYAAAGALPAPILLPGPSMLHQQHQYQYPLAPAVAKRPPPRRSATKCHCKLATNWTVVRWSPIVGLLIPGLGIGVAMVMQGLGSFTTATGTMATGPFGRRYQCDHGELERHRPHRPDGFS